MSAPKVDVLAVMDAATMGMDDAVGDDLREARAAVAELIAAAQELSCDLEHSIALANFSEADTVKAEHPIRVALDKLDAALARVGGAA